MYSSARQPLSAEVQIGPVNTHAMTTCSKAGVFKPKVYLSKVEGVVNDSPTGIHHAMQCECWKTAVHNELQALIRNKTWELCSVPTNRKVIG